MADTDEIVTLGALLDRIEQENRHEERISVRAVVEAVGDRSFGPLLLVPGLLAFSPLSGVPGVPTLVGVMVFLVCGQLLIGRKHFWLPDFVLRRSVSRKRFEQAIRLARRGASLVDRMMKPRLLIFVNGPARYVIAGGCLLLALLAPVMELLPFAITGVGAVITALGFGLLARDGFLILLALALLSSLFAAGYFMAT